MKTCEFVSHCWRVTHRLSYCYHSDDLDEPDVETDADFSDAATTGSSVVPFTDSSEPAVVLLSPGLTAHRRSTPLNIVTDKIASIVISGDENVRQALARLSLQTQCKFTKLQLMAEEELSGIRKFALSNKAIIKANRLRKQLYYKVWINYFLKTKRI